MENAGQVTTPNGQPVKDVAYKVTKGGVTLYFQKDRVSYVYPKREYQATPDKPRKDSVLRTTGLYRMDMVLKGANPDVELKGKEALESHTNYCKASNSYHSLSHYGKVVYKDVYKGIDLVYKFQEGQLKYEFIVKEEGDPSKIAMKYSGAEHLEKKGSGELAVRNPLGSLQEARPVAFVEENKESKVGCMFNVRDQHTVGFNLEASSERPIVIDPYLSVSTYMGGSNYDQVLDVTINNAGNGQVYIAGKTNSAASTFPYQSGKITGIQSNNEGFVAEYNTDGTTLNWITLYGDAEDDRITGIDIRTGGGLDRPYVVGDSESKNLPGSPGSAGNGGTNPSYSNSGSKKSIFAATLDQYGVPSFYAFVGSPNNHDKSGSIIYINNDFYFTGQSDKDFNAINNQVSHQGAIDAVFVSFDDFNTTKFATYYGGPSFDGGKGIAELPSGDILIGGLTTSDNLYQVNGQFNSKYDRFLVRFTPGGSFMDGTVFGGSADDALFTSTEGLDVGPDGYVHLTGFTKSSDLTTTSNAYQQNLQGQWDMFYARFKGVSNLEYATYFGGSDYEESLNVQAYGENHWILAGYSQSHDIPVNTNNGAVQTQLNGSRDPFVAEFKNGDLLSSTYYGGSGKGLYTSLAIDQGTDYFFAAGRSNSNDYYTTTNVSQSTNAGGTDGVLTRFSISPTCQYPNQTTLQNKTYSSSTTLNGNYIVNGYIEITNGTLTIKNASLLFSNCGVLRVKNGANLKIEDATLASCDQFWKGVRVNSNSDVDVNNALFRNAEVAIDARNTHKVTVTKSSYVNNYYDISLRGYNNPNTAAKINENTFKKERPVLDLCSDNPIYTQYHRPNFPKVINIENSDQITPTRNVNVVDNQFIIDSFNHTLVQIFRSENITVKRSPAGFAAKSTDPNPSGQDYFYAKRSRNLTFKRLHYNINIDVPVIFRFINSKDITVNRVILDNNRPRLGQGLLFNGCRNIDVNNETIIDDFNTGIAYYPYAFSSSQSQKTSTIKYTDIQGNKFGLVVAPERNPYQAPSGANSSSNTINLDIKCNKFRINEVGILGSGNLIDQGSSSSPAGNNFDEQTGTSQNTEWDILWQYPVNSGGGIGFNYTYYNFYRPNTAGLNYASYPMNGVQHPCGSSTCSPTQSDFSYNQTTNKGCYASWKLKKSPITSINDKSDNKADFLKVFPNPFDEQLKISFKQSIRGTLNVTNIHGQSITQSTIQGKSHALQTTDWKPGTYIIQIIPENGQVKTRKLLKVQ